MPSGIESWTVIGRERAPVGPLEAHLGWLTSVERSPNTVRAYAFDLKAFWSFLESRQLAWKGVTVEQLGWFAEWLRRPAENVVLLDGARPARSARTVNRMLSAVAGFYEFHARRGERLALDLRPAAGRSGRGGGPVAFLGGIAAARPRGRAGRLPEARWLPRALSVAEAAAVIAAQRRLRDRFLFALLFGTGMRIGQALGLRHEDVLARERAIRLVARDDNANGARAKGSVGVVPVSPGLMRLLNDYMHDEYGALDSDYVFVNLWGGRVGAPLRYATVVDIVHRTRRRVGFHFTPHSFRHTYATLARRGGVPVEVVSRLLTHRSLATTDAVYSHLEVEDLRLELERAGVLDPPGTAA